MTEIRVNGEIRFCLREAFEQCFERVNENQYREFCLEYFAGWILGDLAGECSYEMPVEPDSVENKFAIYAENTNNDGSWLAVWTAYVEGMEENIIGPGFESNYSIDDFEIQRFILNVADELLIPECLVSRGWM